VTAARAEQSRGAAATGAAAGQQTRVVLVGRKSPPNLPTSARPPVIFWFSPLESFISRGCRDSDDEAK